ncbi:MAG TPA: transglutaminase domain-containing protein [bacterium]|nr:transglutaminase domain-containing protein [bacterium]
MNFSLSPPRQAPRKRRSVLLPVLALAALAIAIAVPIARARAMRPTISAIEPPLGEPGATLVVHGKHFGRERGDGRVEFDGAAPTASSYLLWSDDRIEVRIPLYADSSLVRVTTPAGRSNARMFMSRALLPSMPSGSTGQALGPTIDSLSSESGAIGGLLTIRGLNFGTNRDGSSVLFSWIGEVSAQVKSDESGHGYVSPQDAFGEYESWSDKEIRVRIPDGSVSGGIAIKTEKGLSPVRYFQIVDTPGTKSYLQRKTYALSNFVTVSRVRSSGQNALYLWMPFPAETPYQRGVKALGRSNEPLIPDYRGLSVYRLADLADDKLVTITQDHLVQVYGVETDIKPERVKQPADPVPRLYTTLTAPDQLVPSADPAIVAFALKAAGREKNPYRLAQAILASLGQAVAFDARASYESPIKALSAGRGDSWDLAILYAAALRAAGVPSVPVVGVVMDDSRRAWNHAWAEFYVYGFGWVPVDPALMSGATIGNFVPPFEDRSHYFGNMDDRHIAFSRGLASVDKINPDGRTVSASRRYSFQNIFEEASGGLSAYTSFWSDVEITGVY